MAVKTKAYAVSALRAVTYRIASTPTTQLPRSVSQLAAAIWTCREILSTPVDALKSDGDLSVIVHRFKTQLSTLLQDRSVEGRWSAIVLVKATVEAGGLEILSKSNAWVRNLLNILKKPDPPSTRALAILTLTRIFMLTWEYPNLVREITTPALPTFVSTCLSNAENARCSSQELQSILESFEVLISHHPTIFRSNESALRAFLLRIISSPTSYLSEHVSTAQHILALLPFCAPKQGGVENWDELFRNTVSAAHQTCDLIFVPVVEVWRSSIDAFREHATNKQPSGKIGRNDVDAIGLHSWEGLYAGTDRLITLLDQMRTCFEASSPGPIALRLGMIIDLITRICAVVVSGPGSNGLQMNPQVGRDEREALFSALPGIHSSVLRLTTVLVEQLPAIMTSSTPILLEDMLTVFSAEKFDIDVRTATYKLLRTILLSIGSSLNKDDIASLTGVMSSCCNDLLQDDRKAVDKPLDKQGIIIDKKQQVFDPALQSSERSPSQANLTAHLEAPLLLPVLLSSLDASKLSRRLRTQLDRTAVLTKHKNAMLASILNPSPSPSGHGLQNSLLPFLARLFPEDAEVEVLLRPRMPVLYTGNQSHEDHIMADEEDMDSDGVEDVEDEMEDAVTSVDVRGGVSRMDERESSLPTNATQDISRDISSTTKHSLEDTDAIEHISKRPKAQTASSQLQSEWQSAMTAAEDEAAAQEDSVPGNDDQQGRSSSVDPPMSSVPLQANLDTLHVRAILDDAEDDSDFEMPPLTMDPDTDDDGQDE